MTYETTIPYSDCGTDLIERSIHTRTLAVTAEWTGRVTLAEYPTCGARYCTETALSRSSDRSDTTRRQQGK